MPHKEIDLSRFLRSVYNGRLRKATPEDRFLYGKIQKEDEEEFIITYPGLKPPEDTIGNFIKYFAVMQDHKISRPSRNKEGGLLILLESEKTKRQTIVNTCNFPGSNEIYFSIKHPESNGHPKRASCNKI